MPDLDLNQPLPDRAHDALRVAALQAISDLGDGFTLTDVLFGAIDDLYAQIDALNIRCDALQIDRDTALTAIDDLQARVTALEALNPPLPEA